MLYFDYNASSPLLPEARQAWLDAEDRFPGNPSSPHRIGSRVDAALDEARGKVAGWLGCDAADVLWTSGATEACNTALHQVAAEARSVRTGSPPDVWVSAIEHPAVLATTQRLFPRGLRLIPVLPSGVVDLGWIEDNFARHRPALVAVMAANNETGVLQPWREARDLCAARDVPFLCDATQWCGRLPPTGLGQCTYVAGSAHKFGGPRGVGFLKCTTGPAALERWQPVLSGGRQQYGRRGGTENVSGILAAVAAWAWCEQRLATGEHETRTDARAAFEGALTRQLPGARVNGAGVPRLWNTSSIVLPQPDCRQRWVVKLDKAGLAVSTGSACASGQERPSHVLTAMGLSPDEASAAVRFSSGWLTRSEDWERLLAAVLQTHDELSRSGHK